MSRDSFDLVVVGKGAFGRVYKATNKITGDVYALKEVSRGHVEEHGKVTSIIRERDILSS